MHCLALLLDHYFRRFVDFLWGGRQICFVDLSTDRSTSHDFLLGGTNVRRFGGLVAGVS